MSLAFLLVGTSELGVTSERDGAALEKLDEREN